MKVIKQFLDYLKANEKSLNTIKNYNCDLKSFAKWFLQSNNERLALNKITPTDLRMYKKFLISQNNNPKTINRKLSSIKSFLGWGIESKKLKYKISIPKNLKGKKISFRWLNRLEQNELLRKAEQTNNTRDIGIVKTLLNTGIRVSELCELTWSAVVISDRKGKLTVKLGKGNKMREVPLNKDVRSALLDLGYADNIGSESRIFRGQRGNMTPRGVQLLLKRLIRDSSIIDDITPHQLRHTFCKNLVDMKIGLEKVGLLAGHESLDTTKIYCKPSLSDLQEAVELIGETE